MASCVLEGRRSRYRRSDPALLLHELVSAEPRLYDSDFGEVGWLRGFMEVMAPDALDPRGLIQRAGSKELDPERGPSAPEAVMEVR